MKLQFWLYLYSYILIGFFVQNIHATHADFDTTFGDNGIVVTNFDTHCEINKTIVQADGKIISIGSVTVDGGTPKFALVRYHDTGEVDYNFGIQGRVVTCFSDAADRAESVVVQADGKIVVGGSANNSTGFALVRYDQDGTLDKTFGNNGLITTDFDECRAAVHNVTLQPDGKIIVAGFVGSEINTDFAVARYNWNGTLDKTFGSTGIVKTSFGHSKDIAYSVIMAPEGKIIVAGHSGDSLALARYNHNGALDIQFGKAGLMTTYLQGSSKILSVAVQEDGKIIAAGSNSSDGCDDFLLVRYRPNGLLDKAFGIGGVVTTNFDGFNSEIHTVFVEPDGKIVALGQSGNSCAIAKYLSNGFLDNNFGIQGTVTFVGGLARTGIIQKNGKILIGRASDRYQRHSDNNFLLARYEADGTIDTTFGCEGILTTHFPTACQINGIVMQADNKLVATGSVIVNGGMNKFGLVRYNPNGTIDHGFGDNGKVVTHFGNKECNAQTIAIQTNGKILAAGYCSDSVHDFALARYNQNGSLDTTFGIEGKIITHFTDGQASATSIAIQPDQKIIAAGFVSVDKTRNLALARYNPDGVIDNSFGNGGLVITNTGDPESTIHGITVHNSGKIIVVGQSGNNWILACYDKNGILDRSFGRQGLVKANCGGASSVAKGVVIENNKIVVMGMTSSNMNDNYLTIARYHLNGSLDYSFGKQGLMRTRTRSDCKSMSHCIVRQLNDKFIVNEPGSFSLMRYSKKGSCELIFKKQSKKVNNVSAEIHSMLVQPDNKIVAAGVTFEEKNNFSDRFTIARYRAPSPKFDILWGNLDVFLNNDVVLNDVAITFTGNSSIDGRNNTLILATNSQLLVDQNSSLMLKNITIRGIQESSIMCLDASATVSLSNVQWILDDDLTFLAGKLAVIADFSLIGENHTFSYESADISTIEPAGRMILGSGLTFYYNPPIAARDLLQLINSTSQLVLNGATIHATTTGLQLTRGKLVVDQKSFINSDATIKAEGVMFGDGIDSENNLRVVLSPAATLEVTNGFLVHADA